MFEDRRDTAEADEDGGGGDEITPMGKPLRTGKVAMVSQQMGDNKKRLWFLKGYYIQ